jgi:hypothetical protein
MDTLTGSCKCVAKLRGAKGRKRYVLEQQRVVDIKGGCQLIEYAVAAVSTMGTQQAFLTVAACTPPFVLEHGFPRGRDNEFASVSSYRYHIASLFLDTKSHCRD